MLCFGTVINVKTIPEEFGLQLKQSKKYCKIKSSIFQTWALFSEWRDCKPHNELFMALFEDKL